MHGLYNAKRYIDSLPLHTQQLFLNKLTDQVRVAGGG
jgi:hypothetical protein